MKPSLSRLLLATFLAASLGLIGCANKSKKGSGDASDQYGATGSSDTLPGDTVQNARPDGVNPDTDVDYQTLAEYTVYFAFDSSTIATAERGKLDKVADYLKQNPDRSLMLAGHTDARGTLEYNRSLGERRALSVRTYLIGLGVDASKLNTISYGEERPAVQGDTEDAYSKNRRVQAGLIKPH